MLKKIHGPLFLSITVLALTSCKGSITSSDSQPAALAPAPVSLPAAIIVNNQLGPNDEAPVQINSRGEFQLSQSDVSTGETLHYEGVSD